MPVWWSFDQFEEAYCFCVYCTICWTDDYDEWIKFSLNQKEQLISKDTWLQTARLEQMWGSLTVHLLLKCSPPGHWTLCRTTATAASCLTCLDNLMSDGWMVGYRLGRLSGRQLEGRDKSKRGQSQRYKVLRLAPWPWKNDENKSGLFALFQKKKKKVKVLRNSLVRASPRLGGGWVGLVSVSFRPAQGELEMSRRRLTAEKQSRADKGRSRVDKGRRAHERRSRGVDRQSRSQAEVWCLWLTRKGLCQQDSLWLTRNKLGRLGVTASWQKPVSGRWRAVSVWQVTVAGWSAVSCWRECESVSRWWPLRLSDVSGGLGGWTSLTRRHGGQECGVGVVMTSEVSRGRCSLCCWRMVAGRLLVLAYSR